VSCLFELLRLRFAELLVEVIDQLRIFTHLFLDAVYAKSILSNFNDTTSLSGCQNLIRLEPEIKLLTFEYLIKLANKLHGKLFLPDVIISLDNDSHEFPSNKVTEW